MGIGDRSTVMSKKPTAVLDFGTSKVLALVTQNPADRNLGISSAGMAAYNGYMNNHWNNPEEVTDALASEIEEAEKRGNLNIKEIYVGIPGEYIRVYVVESSVTLQGADPKVTPRDVDLLFQQATEMLNNPSGVILHRSPAWFRVDDGQKTMEPVDRKGSRLEGMIGFVLADQHFINDVTSRLDDLGIKIMGFYSSSLGEAMQLIPYEERDNTGILIDVGYLSTEIVAMEGDAIIWQHIVPIGGAHITMDLSQVLNAQFDLCERIKRSFSFNESQNAEIEVQAEDGKVETFSGKLVSDVIGARVNEILELCNDAIDKSGVHIPDNSVIYFTGGGIMPMKGAKVYVGSSFKQTVREGNTRTSKMTPAHIYASGYGLLALVCDRLEEEEEAEGGFFEKIRNFFHR